MAGKWDGQVLVGELKHICKILDRVGLQPLTQGVPALGQ